MSAWKCATCRHPSRELIDRELLAGASAEAVAGKYGLGARAVRYHRSNHVALPESAVEAAEAAPAVPPEPEAWRAKVERLIAVLDGLLASAHRTKDYALLLAVSRELRGTLELAGRADGALQSGAVVNVLQGLSIAPERAREVLRAEELEPELDEAQRSRVLAEALRRLWARRPELREDLSGPPAFPPRRLDALLEGSALEVDSEEAAAGEP